MTSRPRRPRERLQSPVHSGSVNSGSGHPGSYAVEVNSLTKHYGATVAVDNLSFTASYGRITGFLGPNGAGKTTTLRALLGLIKPTSGRAGIGGHSYAELTDPVHTVGASLDSRFHPARTGRSQLRSFAVASGVSKDRVEELLSAVDLMPAANRAVGTYSLGMRQRLGLAAAMLGDPQILILDEPANGLDPQGIRWLRDLLRSLAAQDRAILVSSHVLAEVAQTVDDVVMIRKGRSVLQAPLHTLMEERTDVRVEGPDTARLSQLLRAEGAEVSSDPPGAIIVRGRTREQIGSTIAANQLIITELAPTGSSLEDLFLELTGDQNGKAS